MHILQSHGIMRCAIGVCFLLSYIHAFSQCPFTQSILLPLESHGQAHAAALDFFVDTSLIESTALNRDVYGCANVGIQEITLDIIDKDNLPHTCKEFIVISDPTGYCNDVPQLPKAILGKIVTPIGNAVQGVTMSISNENASIFRGTNEDGLFLFNDIPESNYTLQPSKNNDLKNGVTTQDIILLQKHLIKIRAFDSPYQFIAADVNNSGDITAFDMILLRQAILNSIDHFPNNNSWKFIKTNEQLTNSNSLTSAKDDTYSIDYAPSLSMNNNYIGIKIGDLNNSVFANDIMAPRQNNSFDISITNHSFQKEEVITVPFQLSQETLLEGFQVGLQIDVNAVELLDIEGLSPDEWQLQRNQILISKVEANGRQIGKGTPLFNLVFKAKQYGTIGEILKSSNSSLANELYITDQEIPLTIQYTQAAKQNEVGFNFPNPFSSTTYLPLTLASSNEVQLSVYNFQGQVIFQQSHVLSSGQHQLPISIPFLTDGMYLYEVFVGEEVFSGKMAYKRE